MTFIAEYYRKPVSTTLLIPAQSAMPYSVKRPVLIQEGLRRLRNNCLATPPEENARTLREFNIAMFKSGYSEKFRLDVSSSILYKSIAQLDSHRDGQVNFYRTKAERSEYKRKNKHKSVHKTGWFNRLGYDATLKVPNTSNSELLKLVK